MARRGAASCCAPYSTAYFLARIAKGETILPDVSTLVQGERWPHCTNVETYGRSSYEFSEG